MPESLSDERRETFVCHQHRGEIYRHTDEMRVQRGVVYIMKSKGPTTEP